MQKTLQAQIRECEKSLRSLKKAINNYFHLESRPAAKASANLGRVLELLEQIRDKPLGMEKPMDQWR
jgi:hypothetical protein